MFNARKDSVLGPMASADDPNHWVEVASLGAGQCQESAEKPHLSAESSEEPFRRGQIWARLRVLAPALFHMVSTGGGTLPI